MKTGLVIVSVVAVLLAVSTGVGFWMLSDTEAELADTGTELADIEAELADTGAELAQIKEVYPPRHFDSYNELKEWVNEHTPFEYKVSNLAERNLELQQRALADGYVWGVGLIRLEGTPYHFSVGVAVVDDSFYYIGPDGTINWICGLDGMGELDGL